MNLARKWLILKKDFDSFENYAETVRIKSATFFENKKTLAKHGSLSHIFECSIGHSILYTFILGLAFLITHWIGFTANKTQFLIALALWIPTTFSFRYFYLYPRKLKAENEEIKKLIVPFDEQVSFEISQAENLQKILPILNTFLRDETVQDIIFNATNNSLSYKNVIHMDMALQAYFKNNVNSENFLQVNQAIQEENLKNQPKPENIDVDSERIQFFAKSN